MTPSCSVQEAAGSGGDYGELEPARPVQGGSLYPALLDGSLVQLSIHPTVDPHIIRTYNLKILAHFFMAVCQIKHTDGLNLNLAC